MTHARRRLGRAPAIGLWMLCAAVLASPPPAQAQQARPSLLALDTAAAIDEFADLDGNVTTGMSFDAVVSIGRPGLEAIIWPVVQRLASGQRIKDVWLATLRYERRGPVGMRIEGGLIPSPVGLANLTVRRPHLNPTISQPSALFTPLPPVEAGAPRPHLLGAFYPLGTQIALSARRWDARAAVIDTSPLRRRRILSRTNPPRFTNIVVGGGVTPVVGLRVGASLTRGGWLQAGESAAVTEDLDATIATIEAEFAFRYTKVAGEWVRDSIESTLGTRVASGWFVQGQQTLAPRWFVAARVERISSPFARTTGLGVEQQLASVEEVLGFRLTPEVTVRVGHRARRGFGLTASDHQAAVSLVWWKRWM